MKAWNKLVGVSEGIFEGSKQLELCILKNELSFNYKYFQILVSPSQGKTYFSLKYVPN
jgi:hypothetical protein